MTVIPASLRPAIGRKSTPMFILTMLSGVLFFMQLHHIPPLVAVCQLPIALPTGNRGSTFDRFALKEISPGPMP
ncbi:hypothetical protein [Paraburkholderia bonniea]|uniref:hypothetical protein n=1 Tax=Paraburkholderia bonniea TaxID=2152891 RepID=UPI0015804639|nr:hypothetical protein [Paraburkholderia bonniea]